MKYILPYKIFEQEDKDYDDWDKLSFEEKKAKIFSVYPSIPLEKRAAANAIRKIAMAERRDKYTLDDNKIDFPDKKPIDKIRWNEYFNTLIGSKEIRGHNFEGLIAGLYGADFTEPGSRADLILKYESGETKTISVKSLDSKSESPVLGSVKDSLSKVQIDQLNGRTIKELYNQQNRDDDELKESIWDVAFSNGKNRVDYFLIAYFEKAKKSTGTIFIYIFTNAEMYKFVCSKSGLTSPKNKGSIYQFRISADYKYEKQVPITIKIPNVTEDDLNNVWNTSVRNWGKYVFGDISRKMRTDTIEQIEDEKEIISKRMSQS